MKNSKQLQKWKRFGWGGALFMCLINSEWAIALFELIGLKPKQALTLVTIISSIIITILFYSGILTESLGSFLELLDKTGLGFIAEIIESASHENKLSMISVFIAAAWPATFGGGAARLTGIFYAANIGSFKIYFIFLLGNFFRLLLFDLFIEGSKFLYKKFKKNSYNQ